MTTTKHTIESLQRHINNKIHPNSKRKSLVAILSKQELTKLENPEIGEFIDLLDGRVVRLTDIFPDGSGMVHYEEDTRLTEVILQDGTRRFVTPSINKADGGIFFVYDEKRFYAEGDLLFTEHGTYKVMNIPPVEEEESSIYLRRLNFEEDRLSKKWMEKSK